MDKKSNVIRKFLDSINDVYSCLLYTSPEKWLREKAEAFNIQSKDELSETEWVKVLTENLELEIRALISTVSYTHLTAKTQKNVTDIVFANDDKTTVKNAIKT